MMPHLLMRAFCKIDYFVANNYYALIGSSLHLLVVYGGRLSKQYYCVQGTPMKTQSRHRTPLSQVLMTTLI